MLLEPPNNETAKMQYAEIRLWEKPACNMLHGSHEREPSMAVHNVFTQAIPGAFGLSFLQDLINSVDTTGSKD
jgi:hypothetical protein